MSLPEMFQKMRPYYEEAKKTVKAKSTAEVKRGVGVALGVYGAGLDGPDTSEAWAELNPDGSVTVGNSWEDHGQGADSGTLGTAHGGLFFLHCGLARGPAGSADCFRVGGAGQLAV